MGVNIHTLTGILKRGDELVALLLAHNITTQRVRLQQIMSSDDRMAELCMTVNYLRDHLRVLALDTVPIDGRID